MDRRVRRGHQLLERFRQKIRAAWRLIGHQLIERSERLSQLERRGFVSEFGESRSAGSEVEGEEPVPGGTAFVVVKHNPAKPFHVARADRSVEGRVQTVARRAAELLLVVTLLPALLTEPNGVLDTVVRVSLLPFFEKFEGKTGMVKK